MGMYDKYKEEMLELYKAGMSIRQIASKLNINKGTVSRLIKEDISLRPKSNIPEKNMVYEMFCKGYSLSAIRNKYNCSFSTIKRYLLVNHGVEVDSTDYLKYEHLKDKFKRDYLNGESLRKISETYGVCPQTVLDYLCMMKVPVRNYEVSSRSLDILDTYFNVIDSKEKAYILGMLYARGTLRHVHTSKYLEVKIDEEYVDRVLELTQNFCDKGVDQLENVDKSKSKILRVYSSEIYKNLTDIGLSTKLPIEHLEKQYVGEFYKGLFEHTTSVNVRSLKIKCKDYYVEDIIEHLKELEISPRVTKSTLIIEKNSEVFKFLSSYPSILEYILSYLEINPTVSKWVNFIKNTPLKK